MSIWFGAGVFRLLIVCLHYKWKYLTVTLNILVLITLLSANFIQNFVELNYHNIKIYDTYIIDILDEIQTTGGKGKKILLTDDDHTIYLAWYVQSQETKYDDIYVVHSALLKTLWFVEKFGFKVEPINNFIAGRLEDIFIYRTADDNFKKIEGQWVGLTFRVGKKKDISYADYRISSDIEKYKKSLNKDVVFALKHYSNAYALKGVKLAQNKDFFNATKFLKKSLECDPDNFQAVKNIEILKKELIFF